MSAACLLDPCLRVHLHRGPARPDNDALCGAPGCGNPATHFANLYFYDAVAMRSPYMPGVQMLVGKVVAGQPPERSTYLRRLIRQQRNPTDPHTQRCCNREVVQPALYLGQGPGIAVEADGYVGDILFEGLVESSRRDAVAQCRDMAAVFVNREIRS